MGARELALAVGADDEQRGGPRRADEVREEEQRALVGPVQVVEREHGRRAGAQRGVDGLEEAPARALRVVARGGASWSHASPSASTNGWYGAIASSKQRPERTSAPPAWAAAQSSAMRRVLPMPGSPPIRTRRRSPARARSSAAVSRASGASRPTNAPPARRTMPGTPGGGRLPPARPAEPVCSAARISSASARVSADGAIPSPVRSRSRRRSWAASAAARSPAAARRRTSARPRSSEYGSSATCSRLRRTAAARSPRRLGRVGERAQPRRQALAVRVALGQHPVLLEPGEQLAVAERERLLGPARREQRLDLARVDPRRVERDRVAVGDEADARRAERAAELVERRAQARPGARVEDVGPEARRDGRARVAAGMQREEAEQLAGAAARRRVEGGPVGLEGEAPEHAHAEHRDATLTLR